MIVDEAGRIIYHRNRDLIGKSMSLKKNRSNILSGKDGTGIDYVDGKSLVTYISGTLKDRDAPKYFSRFY
ncbi:hypothetical protein GCM10020331_046640 [Ectobacillus funiculus]